MAQPARRGLIAASVIGAICASSAMSEPAVRPETVTVVNIPVPPGVTRERLDQGIMASVPNYRNVPGLIYKYFTVSENATFGGVYVWKSRADAEAHFTPAWKATVLKTYGAEPKVIYFDVVATTDGPAGR